MKLVVVIAGLLLPAMALSCPEIAGNYSCPPVLEFPAFQMEVKKNLVDQGTEFKVLLSQGMSGDAQVIANRTGFANSDGALARCSETALIVKKSVAMLGNLEARFIPEAGTRLKVVIDGLFAEPTELAICDRK